MSRRIFFCLFLFFFGILYNSIASESRQENNMKKESVSQKEDGAYYGDNPFGVLEFLHWNHPWNHYKYGDEKDLKKSVALMKESGVGWVRMDFLWSDIEPEASKFEFAKYDYIVDLLSENNIHILGLLNYSADWASTCGKWNCPPLDNNLFTNYAVKIVQRYKGKIKHWEVWNEPDSSTYWTDQDSLKSYCILLKDVYIALKEVDPDCKILNGGLANGIASVNHLYDNGAKGYFDILNLHFFESPLNPDAIKRVIVFPKLAYKVMARNQDGDKKIWITEIGCPGVKRGLKVNNWWMGNNPNEAEQAKWLKDVFTSLTREKFVEKVFWAFFRDTKEHWNNGVDYFGLLRWDFTRKPAFLTYKKCFNDWKRSQRH
ncbi:MAG: beta-galactosidase [Candidatus Omnitrophica bacterium]|nr:beta-galactosidase [Candidatus Omnitrophota bacterium]